MRAFRAGWTLITAVMLGWLAFGHAQDEGEQPSAAERIARLKRTIERQQKDIRMYQAELGDPLGEYREAEERFKQIDAQWAQRQEQVERLRDAGRVPEAEHVQSISNGMRTAWQQARDQFNLLIEQRKVIQENIMVLQDKVEFDQAALQELVGGPPAETTAKSPDKKSTTPTNSASNTPSTNAPAGKDQATTTISISDNNGEVVEQELADARAEAQRKQSDAAVARKRVQAIAERAKVLNRSIELEEKLLETAQQRAKQAEQSQASAQQELEQKKAAHAAEAELQNIQAQGQQAEQRLNHARDEVQAITARLRELRGELRVLMSEQEAAEQEAVRKEHEADLADSHIANLQNPFTLRNIFHWLLAHGPKLFLIITGMLGFQRLVRLSTQRIAKVMANASGRGTAEERENRASTLISVFRNAANLAIIGGGGLMLFDEVGIPIVPLMGGAAVLGLAVAFGAQNLIRDYFSGFMVLLEDQYAIGDVVQIGSVTGKVERITLRMTMLRDGEGIVHFIPHGTITTVSNHTHGWSKAVFDIGIGYAEDVDQVMLVLQDLGRELKRDPQYGHLMLGELEMGGIDRFDESSVAIKFSIKTKPQHQSAIKRELLRRIKRRFDDLGIEIPFPSRTVYHRQTEEPAPAKKRGVA